MSGKSRPLCLYLPFAQGDVTACTHISLGCAAVLLRDEDALIPPLLIDEGQLRRGFDRAIDFYQRELANRRQLTPSDKSTYFSAGHVIDQAKRIGVAWFSDEQISGKIFCRVAAPHCAFATAYSPRLIDVIDQVNRAVLSDEQPRAMIFCCKGYTYSIIVRLDGRWLYDSHGSEFSRLYYFPTLNSLAEKMLRLCNISDEAVINECLHQMSRLGPDGSDPEAIVLDTNPDKELPDYDIGIRGLNQKILIVDEAQFAPESLILQAIVPILMMNEAVAIFITTPDDPDSMFMRMVTRVDETGNPRMPVIWLGQPCERCRQEERKICPHVWYEAPAHKSPWRYQALKWIYEYHKDIDARENFAIAPPRNSPSFPQFLVDAFFERNPRPHITNASAFFLACDPACGSENDFAIIGGHYDGLGFTIDFVDAARLQPQRTIVDEKARLRAVITRIRSLPGWGAIPIIFIPEDGPPGAGEKLWAHISDMSPAICMSEAGSLGNGRHRFGVPKTQESTLSSKDMLVEQIADNTLAFSEKLFSLEHIDRGANIKETMDKARYQMYNYRANIKKKYGEYYNDDIVTTLMQLVAWSDQFIKLRRDGKREYREFHDRFISRR